MFVWHYDMYISGHNTDTLQHKPRGTPITDPNMFQAMTTTSGLGFVYVLWIKRLCATETFKYKFIIRVFWEEILCCLLEKLL